MGNLYKQTGDIKNAAWAYQNFLTRFPNSPDRSAVYLELVGCYELLDEKDNLSRLLRDMMSVFPPDSNEYKYAEGSLKIKRPKNEAAESERQAAAGTGGHLHGGKIGGRHHPLRGIHSHSDCRRPKPH